MDAKRLDGRKLLDLATGDMTRQVLLEAGSRRANSPGQTPNHPRTRRTSYEDIEHHHPGSAGDRLDRHRLCAEPPHRDGRSPERGCCGSRRGEPTRQRKDPRGCRSLLGPRRALGRELGREQGLFQHHHHRGERGWEASRALLLPGSMPGRDWDVRRWRARVEEGRTLHLSLGRRHSRCARRSTRDE